MKIALGTVQFGLKYGLSNKKGQVSSGEVSRILSLAKNLSIDTLDTAYLYGQAEAVLGQQEKIHNFRIFSKTEKILGDIVEDADIKKFDKAFHDSLKKLNADKISGLMLHQAEDLLKEGGLKLYEWFSGLKNQGKLDKIGISVYHPKTLQKIMNRHDLDIVQLPTNLMDQRFKERGLIEKMKNKNVEIHARSLYLQGLLLEQESEVDSFFDPVKSIFKQLDEVCAQHNMSRLQLCLAYGLHLGVDRLVIGVTSTEQLKEAAVSYDIIQQKDLSSINFDAFKQNEEKYILPYEWKLSE